MVARDLPCALEIKAQSADGANIHLFATTAEMARFASAPPAWVEPVETARQRPAHDWAAAAQQLERGMAQAQERFRWPELRSRLAFAQLQDPASAAFPPPPKRKKARPLKRLLRWLSAPFRRRKAA